MSSKKCEHARQRHLCKECKALGIGGSQICGHSRRRDQCRDCNGAVFCEHGKRRHDCVDCQGSNICKHFRRRDACRDCNGSRLCPHSRWSYDCSRCNPESAYKDVKRSAEYRGHSFELSFEEYKWIVSSPCSGCGESIEPIGVDRVDSSKGYRFDNCQPLCEMCNRMKLDYSEEEFDQHIIKIIQHRPELVQRAGFQVSKAA